MRTVSSIIRLQEVLVALLHGGVLSRLLRRKATMDTLAALGWSICATVETPAWLVAQHQNPAF